MRGTTRLVRKNTDRIMLSIMERLKFVIISTLVGSVGNCLYSSAAHKGKNRR